MLRVLCLFALLGALSPLLAGKGLVGEQAPAFEAKNCLIEPEAKSLEDCKGDVIVLRFW